MNRSRRRPWMCLLAALACFPGSAGLHAQEAADDPTRNAIRVYQQRLSAMRHMSCRFTPSCSQYAADAIATYGVVEGSARAADRLMRCSSSAESRYPRNSDGLLVDPVVGSAGSPVSVRVPAWLLLPPESSPPPVAAGIAPGRRARLEETMEFALKLEERGDCERASSEYQRIGVLADTLPAHAWAYARIASCYFGASEWYLADRAYLTSAMLMTDPAPRSGVGYSAAVSRFDAGAYVACGRLLADPELAAAAPEAGSSPLAQAQIATFGAPALPLPPGRVMTLAGLCAFALGEWPAADSTLSLALAAGGDSVFRARVDRLAGFARQGPGLPHRSAGAAGAFSAVLPGSGQVYGGHAQDGIRHLIFNAALIYTVVALATHEQVPAAVIVGSIALPFYVGNVLGAGDAARRFNRGQRMRLLERAIEDSSH